VSEIKEVALTESRTLRDQYAGRTDVLDKVKALALLPDGIHVDIPMVAAYFEVTVDAIEKIVQRHREELEGNGLNVLRGEDYRRFAADNLSAASPRARSITLFNRRTLLNAGQLLTGSPIAKAVREYLLDVEEAATPEMRHEAIITRAKGQAEVLRVLDGIVDARWLEAKAREVAARALGEEPDQDPATRPLTVGDYLSDQGMAAAAARKLAPTFGKKLKAAYVRRHGEIPRTAPRFVDGAQRDVAVYTEADRDLFDAVWAEIGGA
jgi:hypothetical protein